MYINEILSHVDHTLLTQTSTWEEIKQIIDEGIKYNTASVCIPPSYVSDASYYSSGRVAICTVIGFPNGYNTTAVKSFETDEAIKSGADEIDMVINLGWVKDEKWDEIKKEIRLIKEICGTKILKVIVETCMLTEAEKIKLCKIISESGADFIKTSTGFGSSGATFEDVILFSENIENNIFIKAAGGISGIEDAEKFISLGADRLGTSKIIKIIKKL